MLSDAAVLLKNNIIDSACYDLSSAVDAVVSANDKVIVPTDIAVAIPQGAYGRIAPRCGLAAKHHLAVGARVIEADYRGNVRVVIFNHGNLDFHVSNGDRIAQLLLERIASPPVVAVESLPETISGVQWFGSSGLNTLSEYTDISLAAAADLSVESLNISDHFEGAVDPNLTAITPIYSVPPNTAVVEHW